MGIKIEGDQISGHLWEIGVNSYIEYPIKCSFSKDFSNTFTCPSNLKLNEATDLDHLTLPNFYHSQEG
jgi:hypothetical protein